MDLNFLKEYGAPGGFLALLILAFIRQYYDSKEDKKNIAELNKEINELQEKRLSESQEIVNKVVLVLEENTDSIRQLNIALITKNADIQKTIQS